MATIREYFDTDARVLTVHSDWELRNGPGERLALIRAKIAMDFEANTRYWYFFVPELTNMQRCVEALLALPETARCVLSPEGDSVYVEAGRADSERQTSATLVFTQRILLYVDAELTPDSRRRLVESGAAQGFHVVVRDREYARKRSEIEKPLAFISHDSRDKDDLVRELAQEMTRLMCPVWYDEFTLKVGDSLRACIERGLRETKKCVVVLSPNFLSNGGWGKAEFDSVFTREILEQDNVILPIWHNVGVKEVYEYSPRMADKVGLPSSLGVQELARRLASAAKSGA
jgi:hypothetical protein